MVVRVHGAAASRHAAGRPLAASRRGSRGDLDRAADTPHRDPPGRPRRPRPGGHVARRAARRRGAAEAEIEAALALINLAVHAHRAATLDPAIADVATARGARPARRLRHRRRARRGASMSARSSSRSPSAGAAPRCCARRSGSPPCSAAAARSPPASCSVRARADLDPGAGGRRRCSCARRSRRCWPSARRSRRPTRQPDFAELERAPRRGHGDRRRGRERRARRRAGRRGRGGAADRRACPATQRA